VSLRLRVAATNYSTPARKTLAVDGVVEQTGRFDAIVAQRVE
jgi:hypothetical protein